MLFRLPLTCPLRRILRPPRCPLEPSTRPITRPVLATGTGTLTWSIVPGYRHTPPGSQPECKHRHDHRSADCNRQLPVHRPRRRHFRTELIRKRFLFSLGTANPPQIVPPSLPSGTVGVAYGPTTLQATGGMGTLTWSISVGSLPPGLTIGPPSTGPSVTISGTPTSQGTFPFTVRVTDSLGQSDTRALSITINLPPPLNITTTSLPAGSIGQTYNQPVAATGGIAPLTWSICQEQGHLPAGLEFGSNDRRDFRNADPAGRHIEFYRPSCRRSRTSRTRKRSRSRSTYSTRRISRPPRSREEQSVRPIASRVASDRRDRSTDLEHLCRDHCLRG